MKKPSSNAQPLRKEQIKDIIKANKKGIKRRASEPLSKIDEDSPGPSPGKLRRFLNISDRLDELVNYLSPPIRQSPSKNRTRRTSRNNSEQVQDKIKACDFVIHHVVINTIFPVYIISVPLWLM